MPSTTCTGDIRVVSLRWPYSFGSDHIMNRMETYRVHDVVTIRRLADKFGIRTDQSFGRELPRLLDRRHIQDLQEFLKCVFLLLDWKIRDIGRALNNCLLKGRWTPRASKGRDLVHNRGAACRFTHDRHAPRVAAKKVNVVLYPFERESLVIQTRVSSAIGLKRGPCKPAESTKLSTVSKSSSFVMC